MRPTVALILAAFAVAATCPDAKAEPPEAVLSLTPAVDSVRITVTCDKPAGAVYLVGCKVAPADSATGQALGQAIVAVGSSAVFTVPKTLAPLQRWVVKATVTGQNASGQDGGSTVLYGAVTASDGTAETPSATIQLTIIKGGG